MVCKELNTIILNRVKNIRAIIFDVDGVLTDGKITYDKDGDEVKSFNVKDGQLIDFMRQNGYVFGAISGRSSSALKHRLDELNIDFKHVGVKNKLLSLNQFIQDYNIPAEFICYIGDDIIDLAVLKNCGLSVAPSDANQLILSSVDLVTIAKGGEGVLREVIDKIILEQGLLTQLLEQC